MNNDVSPGLRSFLMRKYNSGVRAKVRNAVGPNTGLSKLAMTVALPKLNAPIRLPTFPDLARTAVLGFEGNKTLSISGGNTMYAMLLRDPCFPMWSSRMYTTAASAYAEYNGANCPFLDSAAKESSAMPKTFATVGQNGLGTTGVTDARFMPIGEMDGSTWTQAGYGTTNFAVEVVFSGAFTGEVEVALEGYTGAATFQTEVVLTFTASSLSAYTFDTWTQPWVRATRITVTTPGAASVALVAVRIGWTTTSAANGTGSGKTPLSIPAPDVVAYILSPVAPPISLDEADKPYLGSRANATAALLTNVTAVLAKEGTIRAGRIKVNGFGCWEPGAWDSRINQLLPIDRLMTPLEKGLYTYAQPCSSSGTMRDRLRPMSSAINGSWITTASWPVLWLEDILYANVLILSDIDAGVSTQLALTWDIHLEFENTSSLFQTGFSMARLEDYHVSQMALAKQGCFFENPTHLAAIGALVKSALSAIAPIVKPYAMGAASAVGNYVVTKALGAISTRMPQAGLSPAPKPKPKRVKAKPKARPKRK